MVQYGFRAPRPRRMADPFWLHWCLLRWYRRNASPLNINLEMLAGGVCAAARCLIVHQRNVPDNGHGYPNAVNCTKMDGWALNTETHTCRCRLCLARRCVRMVYGVWPRQHTAWRSTLSFFSVCGVNCVRDCSTITGKLAWFDRRYFWQFVQYKMRWYT